jgi:hypothetical protein
MKYNSLGLPVKESEELVIGIFGVNVFLIYT